MEHLTKQQIVLLTLFTSFVTSMATGIVTVSLMDQSPTGVTQTINNVVERTIERVISDGSNNTSTNTANVMDYKDQVAINAEVVGESIVRIKSQGGNADSVTGLGIIVSPDGVVLTDKASVSGMGDLVARLYDGKELPIHVIQSQIDGDIVFAVINIPKDKKDSIHLSPIKFASSVKLGQSVFSLHGKNINSLEQGIIKTVDDNNSSNALTLVSPILTSIDSSNIDIGSPLFTISGEVIGIETTTFKDNKEKDKSIFYPINALKPSIPVISK